MPCLSNPSLNPYFQQGYPFHLVYYVIFRIVAQILYPMEQQKDEKETRLRINLTALVTIEEFSFLMKQSEDGSTIKLKVEKYLLVLM